MTFVGLRSILYTFAYLVLYILHQKEYETKNVHAERKLHFDLLSKKVKFEFGPYCTEAAILNLLLLVHGEPVLPCTQPPKQTYDVTQFKHLNIGEIKYHFKSRNFLRRIWDRKNSLTLVSSFMILQAFYWFLSSLYSSPNFRSLIPNVLHSVTSQICWWGLGALYTVPCTTYNSFKIKILAALQLLSVCFLLPQYSRMNRPHYGSRKGTGETTRPECLFETWCLSYRA